MADQYYWVGTVGPFKYDDAVAVNDVNLVYDGLAAPDASPIVSTGQIQIATAPTVGTHVLREDDIGGIVGNVVGPAASTDNEVVRFDGATGKLIQADATNPTTISDAGDLVLNGSATSSAGLLGQVLADGTAGRVLRNSYILISDGTNVSTLNCQIASRWNGDADGPTDNVAKGATTGNYTLDATGSRLDIGSAAFTGNVLMALGTILINASGVVTTTNVVNLANGIRVYLNHASTGAGQDMTVLVDTGSIYVNMLYLTDA
jgi:hypothetical protein